MNFEKRQNVLIRESRYILAGFLISLFFINILLFQLFLVASTKGINLIWNEFHFMIIGIIIWFICLFIFSKEWEYYKYFKFLNRIDRELRELMIGERIEIIFRDDTKWIDNPRKNKLFEILEENKDLERIFLLYLDKIKFTLKTNDLTQFIVLKNELINILKEKL